MSRTKPAGTRRKSSIREHLPGSALRLCATQLPCPGGDGMAAPSLVRISWIVVGSLLLAAGPVRGQPAEPKKPLVDLYGDPLPAGAIARLGTLRLRNVDDFYLRDQPSLAWTPDGRFLVSGGGGRAVVWDAETGKEIRRFGSDHAYGPASVSA